MIFTEVSAYNINMSRKYQQIFNFIFISVLGTLLHFTYDWSGQNILVGLFSAVNESTWEHLKLLFFPLLLLTILESLFRTRQPVFFLQARTLGIISGMLFIIVVFYTFWGVAGRLIDFINIFIYYLSVIFALWISCKIESRGTRLSIYFSIMILLVITISFIAFTYRAPDIGIFYDLSKYPS